MGTNKGVWDWWRQALQNPREIGQSIPITSTPEVGYYRTRGKDKQWEPVAIFHDEETGELIALRNGQEVRYPEDLWTWCADKPISYEAYEKAMNGGGFNDEPPAPVEAPKSPGIGDNYGADPDTVEALEAQLFGEVEQLQTFLKRPVEDQDAADRVGIWTKRISEIGKKADGLRVVEKEPHLKASREVDDKWRPVIQKATETAAIGKKAVEAFLIAERRKEEARSREEAARAAKLQREAEEAARAAAALAAKEAERQAIEGKESDEAEEAKRNAELAAAEERTARLAEEAAQAARASKVQAPAAGRTGAKVSLRKYKEAKIVAIELLLIALKDNEEVIALVQKIANNAASKAGIALPGCQIIEGERAV